MKIVILGAATFVATLALSTAASAGECRDPWVTTAIYEFTGHKPRGSGESLDCNIKLYGNGSWSSYPDLFNKVKASYRDPQPSAGIAPGANGATVAGARPGIAGGVGVNANGLVAAGGGNLVAAGGGNVIARDGAGLVGNDGSTMRRGNGLVAAGGGN
jgi:hypothetical protein